MKLGKFIANTMKSDDPVAKSVYTDEDWEKHLDWIDKNVIGPPRATASHTVKQLEDCNMIGIYENPDKKMGEKIITLPVYGITITLVNCVYHALRPNSWGGGSISSSLHENCPDCNEASCYGHCEDGNEQEDDYFDRADFNKIMDGIESLILAQAQAGVDVESPAYLEALETAIDAIGNNT